MKLIQRGAVALAGACVAVLAGCAAEQPQAQTQAQQAQAQQTADARNPCTGVAPPTGSIVRRKEDCGGASGRSAATQEIIDQIRSAPGMGSSSVKPGG